MNCPTPGRFHRRRILSIEPPSKLVYTWPTEGSDAEPEQVTVSFNRDGTETEVVILHERILVKTRRDEHSAGWNGCLDKLEAYVLAAV
ncbi:MAG TPA: SRPBCC domain-containing protein [Dehalococcoidia bacterium]|nr:SRPBCC domain-containing protein [Dehalococcoidia bacterium]